VLFPQTSVYFVSNCKVLLLLQLHDKATKLFRLGCQYQVNYQHHEAIQEFEASLNARKQLHIPTTACLGQIGIVYHSLGNFNKAIEFFQKGLAIAVEVGDRAGEGILYSLLGTAYRDLGNFNKALEYHQKDLAIAVEVGDRAGEGKSYHNLGNAFLSLGNFNKAIEYYQKDLAIAVEVGGRKEEGLSYSGLGNASDCLGNFNKAIEYHQKDLAIAVAVGDRAGEARAYCNMGNAFVRLGNFNKAIEYYQKFLAIAVEVGNRAEEGMSYGNLGHAFGNLGNFNKAIEYHQKHLAIAVEVGDRAGEGKSYSGLGVAFDHLGNFNKAIEYQQKFLAIAVEVGDRAGEVLAYHNIGISSYHSNKLCDAVHSLQKAISVYKDFDIFLEERDQWKMDSRKLSFFETQEEIYRLLQTVYIKMNNEDKALEVCEEGRTRALLDRLSAQTKTSCTVTRMKQICCATNATFIVYQLISGSNNSEVLYTWVVDHKDVIFRRVPLLNYGKKNIEKLVQKIQHDARAKRNVEIINKIDSVESLKNNLKLLYKFLVKPIKDFLPSTPDKPVVIVPQVESPLIMCFMFMVRCCSPNFFVIRDGCFWSPFIHYAMKMENTGLKSVLYLLCHQFRYMMLTHSRWFSNFF